MKCLYKLLLNHTQNEGGSSTATSRRTFGSCVRLTKETASFVRVPALFKVSNLFMSPFTCPPLLSLLAHPLLGCSCEKNRRNQSHRRSSGDPKKWAAKKTKKKHKKEQAISSIVHFILCCTVHCRVLCLVYHRTLRLVLSH